jgi:magnesium-transporting ATPase (P-type)
VALTLKRFGSYDHIENIESVMVLDNGEWLATTWERLYVGNVIRVKAGEDFPADVLPLFCKGENKYHSLPIAGSLSRPIGSTRNRKL